MFVAFNRRRLRAISICLVAMHVLSLAPVFANPRGGSVVSGGVSIHEDGALLTVRQSTDRAIINWQGFSNAAGETVRFDQPAATSAVLNRVTGAERSVIDGALQSNGRVFLLNRNGILFGKTANVNTAGLVASTLEMSDDDFRAGRHKLAQDPNSPMRAVVNQGQISTPKGGQVALVAPIVSNEGTITAPEGRVALAAGAQATVTLDGAGLVTLGVRDGAPGAVVVGRDAVSNVLEQAVNNRHLVDAGTSTVNGNGEIVLGGAEGLALNQGTIRVDSATANKAAGQVSVDSTQLTGLARNSLISANGGAGSSAGGDVRVMSQGKTLFSAGARIEAKGGENGDGGFVEVSAPRVWVDGDVTTRGASGKAGSFLIDPTNITIVSGAAPQGVDDCELALNGGATNTVADDDAVIADTDRAACSLTISEGRLEQLAADGNNILLQATNSIVIGDLADCVLNLSGVGVTLQAGTGGISFTDSGDQILAASIDINAHLFGTGALSLGRLQATAGNIDLRGCGITFNNVVNAGAGEIHISSDGAVTQTAGANLLAGGLSLSGTGPFTLTAGTNAVANIASNATGAVDYKDDAALVVNAVNAICGFCTSGANVTLEADAISLNAVSINAGTGTATLIANASAIVTNNGGATDITAGNVSLKAVSGIGTGGCAIDTTTAGTLSVETTAAGGAIAVANAASASQLIVKVNDAASAVSVQSNGGALCLCASTLSASSFVAKPDLTFVSGAGALALSSIDVTGKALSLSSGGAVTQGCPTSIRAASLELLGSSFTLSQGLNDVCTLAVNVTGNLTFNDVNGFSIGSLNATNGITSGGDVVLRAGGAVSQTEKLTATGLDLEGSGSFALNNACNDVNTIAGSAAGGSSFTDTDDLAVGAVGCDSGFTAGAVTLSAGTTLDVNCAISAGGSAVSLTGTGGITLDAAVTGGTVTLDTCATAAQTVAFSATSLVLASAVNGSGSFALGTLNNATGSLSSANQVCSVSFRDDGGFAVGTLSAATSVRLVSTGTVSQTGAINTGALVVAGATAGQGTFNLTDAGNAVTTLASCGQVGSVSFREDGAYTVAGLSAATSVTLQTNNATVAQSAPITTPLLTVQATCAGNGVFAFATHDNDVTNVATGNQVSQLLLEDRNGFNLAGVNVAVELGLESDGLVTQSAAFTAPTFIVSQGAANTGNFVLDTQNNTIGTASTAAQVSFVRLRDDANLNVLGLNAVQVVALRSDGAITQCAGTGIVAGGLVLLGSGVANLCASATNDVNVLAANLSGGVRFRDSDDLIVGTVSGTDGVTVAADSLIRAGTTLQFAKGLTNSGAGSNTVLQAGGAVTQTAGDCSDRLVVQRLSLRGAGSYSLTEATNDAVSVSSPCGTVGAVSFVDANGVNIGDGAGEVFSLANANASFTASGAVTIQEDVNVGSGNLTIDSAGALTQQAGDTITAAGLELLGAGSVTLTEAANNVATLAACKGAAISYRDADALAIGTVNTVGVQTANANITLQTGANLSITQKLDAASGAAASGGSIFLNVGGSISQTAAGAVNANGLEAVAPGTTDLRCSTTNDVVSFAASSTCGFVAIDDANVLTIDTVGATSGVLVTSGSDIFLRATSIDLKQGLTGIATTPITLITRAGGTATQSAAGCADRIVGDRMALSGPGTFNLTEATNSLNSVAAICTGTVQYRDADALNIGFGGIAFKTSGGNSSVRAGGCLIVQEVVAVTGGNLTLDACGSILQTASITAGGLLLLGTGATSLNCGANNVTNLASNRTGSLIYRDADALNVAAICGVLGITNAGASVTLRTGGALAFNEGVAAGAGCVTLFACGAVTQAAGKTLSGAGLELLGAGPFTLTQANAFATIAASTSGAISYTDVDSLTVGNVNTSGLNAGGDVVLIAGGSLAIACTLGGGANVSLQAGACITQTAGVSATALKAVSTGATLLCGASNDVVTIAGSAGSSFLYVDQNNLQVGTVLGTSGIVANGDLRLTAADLDLAKGLSNGSGNAMNLTVSGTASQSAVDGTDRILADRLFLIGPGAFTLDEATNDVNAVATAFTATGAISFRDANNLDLGRGGFNIQTSNANATFQAGGTITLTETVALGTACLTLDAGGAITQNGGATITAGGVRLSGAGGATLDCAANNVARIASNRVGALSYTDADVLAVGTVNGVTGIASGGGAVNLTAGGSIDLGFAINAGAAAVTVRSTGGAITDGNDTVFGDGTVDVTGGAITLSGATGVGATGATAEIEINGTALAADTAGGAGQDVFVNNLGTGALALGLVDAGCGAVSVKSTGSLTDGNDGVPGTLNVRGASIALASLGAVGAAGVAGEIEVQTSCLSATSGGGVGQGIFLSNLSACSFALGTLNAGLGDLTFRHQGAITDGNDTVPGVVNLAGATVTLLAGGAIGATGVCGEIEIASTTLAATGAGDVFLFDTDGTALGLVSAGAAANVSLRSGGALSDGNGGAANVVANQASLQAAGAVGSLADALETTVAALAVTSGGNVAIQETDSVVLGNIATGGGTGVALLGAGASVSQACATAITASEVRLDGGAFSLTGNSFCRLSGNSGSLTVNHATGLIVGNPGQTFTAGGAVNVTAAGALTICGNGLDATGNAVSLTGTSITAQQAVKAASLALTSTGDIIAAHDAPAVSAASSAGRVSLTNLRAGDTAYGGVTANGSVVLTSFFAANTVSIGTVTSSTDFVSILMAGGAASINGTVTSPTQVRVTSAARVLGAGGRLVAPLVCIAACGGIGTAASFVNTEADTLVLDGKSNSVNVGELSSVNAQLVRGSDILLVAGGDLLATSVNGTGAVSVTAGGAMNASSIVGATVAAQSGGAMTVNTVAGSTVTLTSLGAIVDGNGAALNVSGGGTVNLDGASVGSAGDFFDVDAGLNTLNAIGRTGGVFVADPSDLGIGSVTSAGAVGLTAGGVLAGGTITAGGAVTTTSGGAMTLGAVTAAGDLTLTAGGTLSLDTATATGAAALTANGDIADTNGGAVNLTAGATTLRAGGIIGTFGDPFDVAVSAPLRVAAGGIQAAVSIALAGSIGGGARPELLDGSLPGLGIFNGLIFFPFADQGNAAVALATLAVGGVSLRVFDGSQFTLGADLIQNEAGEDEESSESVEADQSTPTSDSESEDEKKAKKKKAAASR